MDGGEFVWGVAVGVEEEGRWDLEVEEVVEMVVGGREVGVFQAGEGWERWCGGR